MGGHDEHEDGDKPGEEQVLYSRPEFGCISVRTVGKEVSSRSRILSLLGPMLATSPRSRSLLNSPSNARPRRKDEGETEEEAAEGSVEGCAEGVASREAPDALSCRSGQSL